MVFLESGPCGALTARVHVGSDLSTAQELASILDHRIAGFLVLDLHQKARFVCRSIALVRIFCETNYFF